AMNPTRPTTHQAAPWGMRGGASTTSIEGVYPGAMGPGCCALTCVGPTPTPSPTTLDGSGGGGTEGRLPTRGGGIDPCETAGTTGYEYPGAFMTPDCEAMGGAGVTADDARVGFCCMSEYGSEPGVGPMPDGLSIMAAIGVVAMPARGFGGPAPIDAAGP